MSETQKTVARSVELQGTGLHTGHEVRVRISPAGVDEGITFIRRDLAEAPTLAARADAVSSTDRETTLGAGEVTVHTVEHLLSAAYGLGIHNLQVEVWGEEIPILDGSALPFAEKLAEAGVSRLSEPIRALRIREPVWMTLGAGGVVALPDPEFRVTFTLHYPGTSIGTQHLSIVVDPETYARDLAPARTFCLEEEIEALRRAGLIQGGSLANAVVFGKGGPKNKEGLRFSDEPVRHKILDFIGDMALLGVPVQGHFLCHLGGHALNLRLAKKLLDLTHKTEAHYHRPMETANEQLDIQAIQKILPHRPPFLFVDRILSIEQGKRIVGLKNITGNESFFRGHFPSYPVMPGVLIIEAMAQVGGVMMLSGAGAAGKLVFFLGIDDGGRVGVHFSINVNLSVASATRFPSTYAFPAMTPVRDRTFTASTSKIT